MLSLFYSGEEEAGEEEAILPAGALLVDLDDLSAASTVSLFRSSAACSASSSVTQGMSSSPLPSTFADDDEVVARDDDDDNADGTFGVLGAGTTACVNPYRAASESRRFIFGTSRNSPPSPISPIMTIPCRTRRLARALTTAVATAKSAARSLFAYSSSPPVTFKYTSAELESRPRCWESTANSISARLRSTPWKDRIAGARASPLLLWLPLPPSTSACTSDRIARLPSNVHVTALKAPR